jgi:single-stranded DNA-binding protein
VIDDAVFEHRGLDGQSMRRSDAHHFQEGQAHPEVHAGRGPHAGATASQAYPFLHKGSVVAAKGYWQTRNYQQDGRKRVAMEMVAQEIAFVSGIDWSAAQEAEEEISQRIKSVIPEEMEALAANPGGTEDDDDGEG